MWTRELLKTNAKQCLSCTWKTTILVVLAYMILSGTQVFNVTYNADSMHNISNTGWTVLGGLSLVGILLAIFFVAPLKVGYYRYFMEARLGDAPFSTLFGAFRKGDYGKITLSLFMTDLKIFLFGLLLVIPGIIKAYEYVLVPYLLAENPQMDHHRAQELSRRIMYGEKLNLVILELSFFGWILLGSILIAIVGTFVWFLLPVLTFVYSILLSCYMEATRAEFYAAMREKAFAQNLSSPEELAGFIAY